MFFFCIFCKRRKSCLQVDCFIRTIQRPHDVIGVMVAATVLSGWYKIVSLALARNRIVCLFFSFLCMFCLVYFSVNVDAQSFFLCTCDPKAFVIASFKNVVFVILGK